MEGFLLPWTGISPLLATLAVGILAVHVEGRNVIAIPLVFLCGMGVGIGLSGCGIFLPYVHVTLALSVVLSGMALALGKEYPVVIAAIAMAIVGILNGHAAAESMSSQTSPFAFLLAMLFGTALLLGVAVWIGLWMEARTLASRGFGILVGVMGIGMLGWAVFT